MRPQPIAALLALPFALAGCATSGVRTTEIVTEPPGALVRVEGYGECVSPCVIAFDAPRMITIAKAGYRAQRFELKPGKSRLVARLELAAPTRPVEEGALEKL